MNRCAICNITEEDNPKADIITVAHGSTEEEDLCEQCRKSIEEVTEDFNLADLEAEVEYEQTYWNEIAVSKPGLQK